MATPADRDQRGGGPTRVVAVPTFPVLAVVGALAVLVLLGIGLSGGPGSVQVTLRALVLLPAVLGVAVEILVWRGRTVATRAVGWTLFGGAVLAMAPLVLWALLGLFFTYRAAMDEDTGGDRGPVAFSCAITVLSLAYAVLLGARLTGRGRGRGSTTVRVGVLVLVAVLWAGYLVRA